MRNVDAAGACLCRASEGARISACSHGSAKCSRATTCSSMRTRSIRRSTITSISARKAPAAAAASAAAAAGATDMADKDVEDRRGARRRDLRLAGHGDTRASRIAADAEAKWDIDSALLYYGESDGRVKDVSLSAHATRDFGDERKLGLDLTVDSLTGASPSGAIATDGAQTFTSPSGRKTYTTPAGEIPLDDTFLDTRFALNGSWSQPLRAAVYVERGTRLLFRIRLPAHRREPRPDARLQPAQHHAERGAGVCAGHHQARRRPAAAAGADGRCRGRRRRRRQSRREQRQQERSRRAARRHAGARPAHGAARQLFVFRFERLSHRSLQDSERRRPGHRRSHRAYAGARRIRTHWRLSFREPPGFAPQGRPVRGDAPRFLAARCCRSDIATPPTTGKWTRIRSNRACACRSAIELPRAARALLHADRGVVLSLQPGECRSPARVRLGRCAPLGHERASRSGSSTAT